MPAQQQINRSHQNFLALDLEMNQPSGRIIQVGICIGNRFQSEEEYLCRQWLVNPDETVSPAITTLTGIDDQAIQTNAVSHRDLACEIGQLITDHACFVNPVTWGGGDSGTLLKEFADRGIVFPYFGRRWLDVKTFHVMRALALGKSHAGGLGKCMAQYQLRFTGNAHRADADALNTLRLFFRLQERQATLESLIVLAKGL